MRLKRLLPVVSLLLLALCLMSCDEETKAKLNGTPTTNSVYLSKVFYKGHSFIMSNNGGIVHDPNCSCYTDTVATADKSRTVKVECLTPTEQSHE